MPEEFLRKLSGLGSKTDRIAGKVLEAGAEVVKEAVSNTVTEL